MSKGLLVNQVSTFFAKCNLHFTFYYHYKCKEKVQKSLSPLVSTRTQTVNFRMRAWPRSNKSKLSNKQSCMEEQEPLLLIVWRIVPSALQAMQLWRTLLESTDGDSHTDVSISETFRAVSESEIDFWSVWTSHPFAFFQSVASFPFFTQLLPSSRHVVGVSSELWRGLHFWNQHAKKRTLQLSCCERYPHSLPSCKNLAYLSPSVFSCKSFVSMCLGSMLNK